MLTLWNVNKKSGYMIILIICILVIILICLAQPGFFSMIILTLIAWGVIYAVVTIIKDRRELREVKKEFPDLFADEDDDNR